MNQRTRIWLAVLAGAAFASGVWWWHSKDAASATSDHKDGMPWSMWASQMPNAAPTLGAAPNPPATAPEATRPTASPLDTIAPSVFHANADGSLVIDAQTRNDVERLQALYQGAEAQQKLALASAALPARAKRELKDLYQNYAQYTQAVTQAFPSAQSTGTIDEAQQQLNGLKDLRRQYFGPDTAQAIFGPDEAMTQDLLNHIAANKDPKMSFDDKVNKAQQDVSKSSTYAPMSMPAPSPMQPTPRQPQP